MIAVRSLVALGFLVLLMNSLEAREIRNRRDLATGVTYFTNICDGCVINLTDSNFDEKVLDSDLPWLVAFYAPWCKWSNGLLPQWTRAAKALKDKVKVGLIDAEVNPVKVAEYGIKIYPTIKYFPVEKESDSVMDDYSDSDYPGSNPAAGIFELGNDPMHYCTFESEKDEIRIITTSSTVPPTTETTRATITTAVTPTSTATKLAATPTSPTTPTKKITSKGESFLGNFMTFLVNWL